MVLLVTIIIFVILRLTPGDPALANLNDGDSVYTQTGLDALRHELGTDRPIPVQYLSWIGNEFVTGSLGTKH